jgi:hypothetical protein
MLVKLQKYVLRDFSLLFRGRPPENIETDLEPLVCLLVEEMVFIAQFQRCNAVFQSFGFCSCAIFIRPADKYGIVISSLVVPKCDCQC